MVRSRGLEPPRDFSHNDLNVARIPIPPRPHEKKKLPIEAIVRYIETSQESSIFAEAMSDKLEWKIEKQPVAYPTALETMEKRVADIGHCGGGIGQAQKRTSGSPLAHQFLLQKEKTAPAE